MSREKERVKVQFGSTASGYVESEIHAKGQDLKWLVQAVKAHQPQPLLALDVATGTGHTAFALRQCVSRVVGLDLTEGMLEQAKRAAKERNLDNLVWMMGDAEDIPMPDGLFDVVTCRIAAHHFPEPLRAFQQCHRLLRDGGLFILVDNVSPADPTTEVLYNQVEKWRDPSHGWVFTESRWSDLLRRVGFSQVEVLHRWENQMQIEPWLDRAHTPQEVRERIRTVLKGASVEQQQMLGFRHGDSLEWIMRKAMWLATK
ncbi:class I SAM-dependent methyltransferase [Desmospora profundinema]|uniref:Ubiquinone/menaquinone biosynthesis C-methylase UbiE n=1 Tax=Desmospora profundinema TaxID=1571184 RepID=A0ABU1IM43_9BACL|nr:class I SAM-dependent methyltransferase [Desmospora profundinema]MDR6225857.1 ubiquinone/menaquinone biosynthesis C-methylase UbiE [Desmospora profundinema]